MNRRYKMPYLVGIMMCIIMVLGWMGSFFVNRVADLTEKLYEHPLTVSTAVLRIHSNMLVMRLAMKDLVRSNSPEHHGILNQAEEKVLADFDLVEQRFLGDIETVRATRRAFIAWQPIRAEIIRLMLEGKGAEAELINQTANARQVAEIENKINEMRDFARNKAREFLAAAKETRSRTMWYVWFSIGGSVILAGFVMRKAIRLESNLRELNNELDSKVRQRTSELAAANESLSAQYEEITAQNEEIIAQNEEINVLNENLEAMNKELEQHVAERTSDLTAAHEELSAQFEELTQSQESLRRSAEIQDALREIAEAAVQVPSLDELYAKVHQAISRVLPARNFYISLLDEENGMIVRPYCVEDDNLVPRTRPIGRGLTEYIMRTGLTVHITPDLFARLKETGEVTIYIEPIFECMGAPLRDSHGKIFGVITLYLTEEMSPCDPDDTRVLSIVAAQISQAIERKQSEENLVESEARYRAVIEQAPEAILLCDPDTGAVVEANSRFTERFGYDLRQGEPLTLFELVVDEPEQIRGFFDKLNKTGSLPVQRRICKHRNGTCLTVERSATLVSYRGRNLFVMTLRDVTDEVRREQAEYYQATHDELTGLYNRRGFVENVVKAVASGTGGALLLVDIDDFKLINDVYGHIAGDQYLAAFGAYLNENYKDAALIARFGGDEFILFFAGPDGLRDATRTSALMEVICLETEIGAFFVQLSGGIALISDQEPDLNLQIQRAYLALHHAKESGKWCCKTYEPVLQDKFTRRYLIREALNQALPNGEFRLVFQPIFDIREGAGIVGYEVLLRWMSRQLGDVSPAEFIPVAEETNLILPIGKWVLQHACQLSANMGALYGECINVAVNISMLQLAMPNFVTMVKEILQETGLPACYLSLEVTESILMTDAATRISYLQELCDFGVSISLDDFGTGYSSFTYLSQLPISTLKIDKSMVREISGGSSKSLLLLESLLQLSTLLGYKVVAEGVQTVEQLDFLKSKGYSYCQGYLLGRPMEEADLLAMVGGRQQSGERAL